MMTDSNKYRNISLTHAVYSKLDKLSKTITPGIQLSKAKTVEALVESLIAKALTPDGKPMFNRMDKTSLLNEVDPKVILRVCTVLNQATSDYEDVKKN